MQGDAAIIEALNDVLTAELAYGSLSVTLGHRVHLEGTGDGPFRMIGLRDRGAEYHVNGVAHDLVHGALVLECNLH